MSDSVSDSASGSVSGEDPRLRRAPDVDLEPVVLPAADPVGPTVFEVSTSAAWNPGSYALLFAITALASSLLVGWLLPLGVIGVVFSVIALRRRSQRRRGAWALALSIVSILYSIGWLVLGFLS